MFEAAQQAGAPFRCSSAGRPAEVWTMAVLYAAGVGRLRDRRRLPAVRPGSSAPLLGRCGGLGPGGGRALAVRGGGDPACPAPGSGWPARSSRALLIAFAVTPQGELVTAFGYLWVAVYAAHFFGRREAWRHTALITVGFGVAVSLNDAPIAPSAYVIVVATIWVAVTVLANLTTRLRVHAATDQLTGLLNRSGFRAAAEREHALSLRTGVPLSLVVIDLDDFKAVNDWRGHAAGDQMLVELAQMWRLQLRRCDVIGRHGGDEFVLLLPATDHAQATLVLARLRAGSPIGWSAGVAEWRREESFETCLSRADTNLYLAKPDRAVPLQRSTDPGVRVGQVTGN